MNAASHGYTEEFLLQVVSGESEGDIKEKVRSILETVEDVKRFSIFESAREMGITFRPSDISFTDFLIYRWIREARKPK